jgi:hypothetical protein
MMTKWEYQFLTWNVGEPRISEDDFNAMGGAEGWELVFFGVTHQDGLCIFKRPVPSVVDMHFSVARKSDDPMAVANLSAHDGPPAP